MLQCKYEFHEEKLSSLWKIHLVYLWHWNTTHSVMLYIKPMLCYNLYTFIIRDVAYDIRWLEVHVLLSDPSFPCLCIMYTCYVVCYIHKQKHLLVWEPNSARFSENSDIKRSASSLFWLCGRVYYGSFFPLSHKAMWCGL